MKIYFSCMEKCIKFSLRKLWISGFCSALISNYWSRKNDLLYHPSLKYSQYARIYLHTIFCTQLRTLKVFGKDLPLTRPKLNWRSLLTSESESVGLISYVSLISLHFINLKSIKIKFLSSKLGTISSFW